MIITNFRFTPLSRLDRLIFIIFSIYIFCEFEPLHPKTLRFGVKTDLDSPLFLYSLGG